MTDNLDVILSGEGPFYTEYLYKVLEVTDDIGLAYVDWTNAGTKLKALKDPIVKLFNENYYYREIGSETVERWQNLLNRRFERLKREYEFKLEMYDENDISNLGRKITTTSNSEYQDTPVTSLEGDYATNKNSNVTVMDIDVDQKATEIENVFNKYHDLIREFVDRFDDCFIDVLGRI